MDDIVFRLEREAAREPNEPIWRDAAMEIKALRHAVETLLGDTDDSTYMSRLEQRELAMKALHNFELDERPRRRCVGLSRNVASCAPQALRWQAGH